MSDTTTSPTSAPSWAEYTEPAGTGRVRHGYGFTDVIAVRGNVAHGVPVEVWQESDADGGDRREPQIVLGEYLTLDVHQARTLARELTELCDLAAPDLGCPWPADDVPEHMVWLDACGPLTIAERERFATATPRDRDAVREAAYRRLADARLAADREPAGTGAA